MPRGDRTGPNGMGPMTGRGAGYCAGFAAPGYANPFSYAPGYGCGHGHRRMYCATGIPGWARFGYPNYADPRDSGDEKEILKSQAGFLENQLEQIKKRLSDIDGIPEK